MTLKPRREAIIPPPDVADERYRRLQFDGAGGSIYLDEHSVLVKPGVAA